MYTYSCLYGYLVKKDIRLAVVRSYKAVTFHHVEPFTATSPSRSRLLCDKQKNIIREWTMIFSRFRVCHRRNHTVHNKLMHSNQIRQIPVLLTPDVQSNVGWPLLRICMSDFCHRSQFCPRRCSKTSAWILIKLWERIYVYLRTVNSQFRFSDWPMRDFFVYFWVLSHPV